jgi:hypothetical protein
MQATAAANPRFDGRDPAALAAEHAAVRDAALASFRRSRPNYVAGFEGASSPSGETLAKKPEVRVWNEMRPSAAAERRGRAGGRRRCDRGERVGGEGHAGCVAVAVWVDGPGGCAGGDSERRWDVAAEAAEGGVVAQEVQSGRQVVEEV